MQPCSADVALDLEQGRSDSKNPLKPLSWKGRAWQEISFCCKPSRKSKKIADNALKAVCYLAIALAVAGFACLSFIEIGSLLLHKEFENFRARHAACKEINNNFCVFYIESTTGLSAVSIVALPIIFLVCCLCACRKN